MITGSSGANALTHSSMSPNIVFSAFILQFKKNPKISREFTVRMDSACQELYMVATWSEIDVVVDDQG